MSNTEPATPTMHSLNPKPLTVHGTGGTPAFMSRVLQRPKVQEAMKAEGLIQ